MQGISSAYWNSFIGQAQMGITSYLSERIYSITVCAMSKMFFWGLEMPSQEKVAQRNEALLIMGAERLSINIETFFLPASKSTNQIILFALHKPWQRLLPKNYTHFKESADVVLWNPTGKTTKQYEPEFWVHFIGTCRTFRSIFESAEQCHRRICY